MRVLVGYATKHGGTGGIAERIGTTLSRTGHEVDVRPVDGHTEPEAYDAFVVGSAAYAGRWRKEAKAFVEDHRDVLAQHPVWLFSSGPLGTEKEDGQGRDLRELSEPKDLPDLVSAVHPRDHRVFFGQLDPAELTLPERTVRKLPAARAALPEGDFRDWADIDGWAETIGRELQEE